LNAFEMAFLSSDSVIVEYIRDQAQIGKTSATIQPGGKRGSQ